MSEDKAAPPLVWLITETQCSSSFIHELHGGGKLRGNHDGDQLSLCVRSQRSATRVLLKPEAPSPPSPPPSPPSSPIISTSSRFSNKQTQVLTDAQKLRLILQRLTDSPSRERERESEGGVGGGRERERERETPTANGAVDVAVISGGFSPLIPFTQLPKDLLYEIAAVMFEPIAGQRVEYLNRRPISGLGAGGWACPAGVGLWCGGWEEDERRMRSCSLHPPVPSVIMLFFFFCTYTF